MQKIDGFAYFVYRSFTKKSIIDVDATTNRCR